MKLAYRDQQRLFDLINFHVTDIFIWKIKTKFTPGMCISVPPKIEKFLKVCLSRHYQFDRSNVLQSDA